MKCRLPVVTEQEKEKQIPAVCSPLQLHHKAEQGDNVTPSFIVAR